MERRSNLIGLGLMGLAVILAFAQWIAAWSGNVLSSVIEGVQAWALIPLAVVFVAVLAYQGSSTFSDFIRRFFSIRANLVLPVTMLAYLSTTWLSGFHEKYDVTAWQNGTALKGFWLGTIAQGHAANPFGAVHYSFWVNILQWLVDHSVYTWFGWVVIASEATIALTFITAIVAAVYRPAIVAASTAPFRRLRRRRARPAVSLLLPDVRLGRGQLPDALPHRCRRCVPHRQRGCPQREAGRQGRASTGHDTAADRPDRGCQQR